MNDPVDTHVRDVLAIDGEGRDLPDGSHIYTLLNSYDSKVGKTRYIENVTDGLSTWELLDFLLWLRCGRGTIPCAYFFNYDVAMWLKDVSDEQKTVLWKSGQVVLAHPSGARLYYLRYIPNKLFFVGDYRPDMGSAPSEYHYPGRYLRIYDVSGFAQKSFVKALKDWDITVGDGLIAEMKTQRGTFTANDAERVRLYCQAECKALAQYVQCLDTTFQEEGIRLISWYGGGALASHFMQREGVQRHVKDPQDPQAYAAVLSSYFGGRAEICRMGHLQNIYDYDISSAYPAASLYVPDLCSGSWQATSVYDPDASYALWHVSWDTRRSGRRLGPLPFRYKKGVYYPDVGAGWVHACELAVARRYYGDTCFRVSQGWVYQLGDKRGGIPPFDFVRELAGKRVDYKATDYRRSVPYKYGLNSIYGKLAQHAVDAGRLPPYQCYYAAGIITAYTRAQLLSFVYEDGQDDSDIVLLATDGVFCQRARTWHVNTEREELGRFGKPTCLEDAYFIQPGCWYSKDGILRSRGFGAKSLDYERVAVAWQHAGLHSQLDFSETRFVGLGTCAGRGDYGAYGRWIRDVRTLTFYPDRKYPALGYTGYEETVPLVPYSFPDRESEVYVSVSLRDTRGYVENLTELLNILYAEDQPDIGDE